VTEVTGVTDTSGQGVELADVLAEIEATLRRYVVLPGDVEATALTLWVAHTHALDGAHATPYLLVMSPEKRSGKTRLLEVIELLVARPWRVTSASEAALFRKIGQERPTLLLDEVDAIFNITSQRTEALRAVINGRNRPGAAVARCVGEKGDTVKDFKLFCPKVLAGIDTGRLPDTIRDRGVTLELQRKTAAERIARFRHRDADVEVGRLRAALAAWSATASATLLAAEPELPAEINDRAAEAWEPLVAIADLAGDEWASRARVAALSLSGNFQEEEVSHGLRLLAAIRTAFGHRDNIRTAELLEAVNADDELPFGEWRDGMGLDPPRPRALAASLQDPLP
jgi:Protein of unknown function (DUF3631)